MVRAWYYDNVDSGLPLVEDKRLPHIADPAEYVNPEDVSKFTGIKIFQVSNGKTVITVEMGIGAKKMWKNCWMERKLWRSLKENERRKEQNMSRPRWIVLNVNRDVPLPSPSLNFYFTLWHIKWRR